MQQLVLPHEWALDVRGWQVPAHVEINHRGEMDLPGGDGLLCFSIGEERAAVPHENTFADFLNLEHATPRQILRFARSYGPLSTIHVQNALGTWQLQCIVPIFRAENAAGEP